MKAGYNFELENSGYGDNHEVVVIAESYKEAEKKAKSLLDGSKMKLGKLRRVIDAEAQVQYTNVVERKMTVEERQLDVKHSGEITEVRVDGGQRSK